MATDAIASAEVEQWKSELQSLYHQIEQWLKGPLWLQKMELPAHIERHAITLNEQRSGPYPTEELVITYTGRHMKLRPKARWVVGADGRVDLTGSAGHFLLVLLNDRGGWFYLEDRATADLRRLDEVLFVRLAELSLQ